MKRIDITIDENGEVRVIYKGFIGEECFTEAKRLYNFLRKLGVHVNIEKTVKTKEYYSTKEQHKVKLRYET